jgi:hypothetical protein
MITIPDSKQEIFDIISNHLLTQMKRSDAPGPKGINLCKYLNPDGLKCAAGILIPNDQYDPEMEGKSWDTLVSDGFVEDKFAFLIYELQGIHDWTKPEDWKIALIKFAKQNHLTHSIEV